MRNVMFIEGDLLSSEFLLNAIRAPDVHNISGSETDSDQLLPYIFFEIELWIEQGVKTIFITETFFKIGDNDRELLYSHISETVEKFGTEFVLISQLYEDFSKTRF